VRLPEETNYGKNNKRKKEMGRVNQGNNKPVSWQELPETTKKAFLAPLDKYSLSEEEYIVDWYIDGATGKPQFYDKEKIDELIALAKEGKTQYYGLTDSYLYACLEQYPIEGKTVAVLGSVAPWYEAVVLAYGGIPYTIEYNKIETNDSRLNLITVEEFNKNPQKFDYALSISSFEHDGLGRYGDPVDPDGDFKAMKNTKENIVKKGGYLFLSVPVGRDQLAFNAHRIYGRNRLNDLCEGWQIRTLSPSNFMDTLDIKYQPVLVLENA